MDWSWERALLIGEGRISGICIDFVLTKVRENRDIIENHRQSRKEIHNCEALISGSNAHSNCAKIKESKWMFVFATYDWLIWVYVTVKINLSWLIWEKNCATVKLWSQNQTRNCAQLCIESRERPRSDLTADCWLTDCWWGISLVSCCRIGYWQYSYTRYKYSTNFN